MRFVATMNGHKARKGAAAATVLLLLLRTPKPKSSSLKSESRIAYRGGFDVYIKNTS